MDKAKADIAEIKCRVSKMLECGVTVADAGRIAGLICDIEAIERFVASAPHGEHPFKDIEDELHAAEKYYKRWMESGDAAFKDIGRDELRHADALIRRARAEGVAEERLREYETRYQVLMGKME